MRPFSRVCIPLIAVAACILASCEDRLGKTDIPDRGFWSEKPADTWEQALVTGNGTQGALVMGIPLDDDACR